MLYHDRSLAVLSPDTSPLPSSPSALSPRNIPSISPVSFAYHPADYTGPLMDSSVPYPNFYPYVPNEVKHRKRTSSTQLKVLETMFKTDTKPNATLRKKLAQELDMTPRGVQVWFQNRRAKEKNKTNKSAEAVKRQAGGFPTSPAPADASSPPELGSPSEDTSAESASSHQARESPWTWNVSPAPTPAQSSDLHFPCPDPYLMRRGSLPVDLYFQPSPSYPTSSDHANEFARRCSVDTSLAMLARNPYANLASRRSLAMHQINLSSRFHQRPISSLEMGHVSLDPHAMYYHDTSSSSSSLSHSPSPHSALGSLPDSHTAPSRVVPQTIPGPLPTEGFIFGAASSYNQSGDFADTDDTALPSYDALPHFGSIASTATSDSSASAYFSECGDDAYLGQPSRRGSASGINDLMSTMTFHPNAVVGNDDSVSSPGESRDGSDRTTKYPSPAPTVSPPSASPIVASVEPQLAYPATYMEGGIDPHAAAIAQTVYTTQQPHTDSSLLDMSLQYPHASEYVSTGHYQDPSACYAAGAYPPMQGTQGEYGQVVQVSAYAGGYPTDKQPFV